MSSTQGGKASPLATRVGRAEEEFNRLRQWFQVRIRRLLIHPAYRYQEWVTPHTYMHPELEGVPGIIEEVETDYAFYRVRFPSIGETFWFPEPELTRAQAPAEGAMPGAPEMAPGAGQGMMPGGRQMQPRTRQGMQPGAGQGMQPGAGSREEPME